MEMEQRGDQSCTEMKGNALFGGYQSSVSLIIPSHLIINSPVKAFPQQLLRKGPFIRRNDGRRFCLVPVVVAGQHWSTLRPHFTDDERHRQEAASSSALWRRPPSPDRCLASPKGRMCQERCIRFAF